MLVVQSDRTTIISQVQRSRRNVSGSKSTTNGSYSLIWKSLKPHAIRDDLPKHDDYDDDDELGFAANNNYPEIPDD